MTSSTRKQLEDYLRLLEEQSNRLKRNKFRTLYPDTGQYSRDKYPKHLEFFGLGAAYNERALFGGNRSGKTVAGCYEDTLHLTGLYPEWWTGKRFTQPTDGWVAGDTAKTARDILQAELLGKPSDPSSFGTGLIPADTIIRTTQKHGLADAFESVSVRHVSGGVSVLQFKSYDQGRDAFQGTSKDFVHLDEDCAQDIYAECFMRLLTTNGCIYWTATLVEGLTPLMLDFMPNLRPTPDG